jgi:protease I
LSACYPEDVQINELRANNAEYLVQHVVARHDIIIPDGPDGAKEFGESLVAALR